MGEEKSRKEKAPKRGRESMRRTSNANYMAIMTALAVAFVIVINLIVNALGSNFTQIDFLYATMPDIVILCININDETEIIERTIKFIKGAVGCKIAALVVYPIFYEEEDIYKQRKAEMNIERFQLYKKKLEKNSLCLYFY